MVLRGSIVGLVKTNKSTMVGHNNGGRQERPLGAISSVLYVIAPQPRGLQPTAQVPRGNEGSRSVSCSPPPQGFVPRLNKSFCLSSSLLIIPVFRVYLAKQTTDTALRVLFTNEAGSCFDIKNVDLCRHVKLGQRLFSF